ncbi:hypothetical protein ACLESD_05565, partial [Pyxidicoccus sp. 3LFB2]
MSRRGLLALCLLLSSCKRTAPASLTPDAGAPALSSPGAAASAAPVMTPGDATHRVQPLAVCRAEGTAPLDAARRYF